MALFDNPLGHAGYPPGVTGTPTTQPSAVRAATSAEATDGTLDDCYLSPATGAAASAASFASPPVLGYGSTTPRPVAATTLSTTGNSTFNGNTINANFKVRAFYFAQHFNIFLNYKFLGFHIFKYFVSLYK
jgi:hypothetical protein